MKIEAVAIVHFSTLQYADLFKGSFEGPSYGGDDSVMVLCHPLDLVEELKEESDLPAELIKELEDIPEGVLVALPG